MTDSESRRVPIWLTPTAGLVAVVAAAALGVVSWNTGTRIRGEIAGTPVAAPASTPEPTYSVSGKIRLGAGEYARHGQECRSTTFAEDAQVIVTNARGASLTYAQVGAGKMTEGNCDIPFTFTVPAGEGSYGVDVPGWGMAKYTEPQLADTIDLTYG